MMAGSINVPAQGKVSKPASLEALVTALIKLCGPANVSSDDVSREAYSRATLPQEVLPSVIVHPKTTTEVQGVFQLANTHSTPVWCFSGGHNWGYGTKNALQEGAIILMLDRMNRILDVNEALAYAVIEPGVTQQQLSCYLKEHHPTLWTDCTDSTPLGSIIGNSIERGIGYTRYGDHFGQLCGLEVVLPDGKVLHPSGGRDTTTRHTHKWGHGPFLDGLFSQSNLGVVTQAGVWLMPKPAYTTLFTLGVSEAKLPEVVNQLGELSLKKVIQGHPHMVNAYQMATVVCQPGDLSAEERGGYIEDRVLERIYQKYKIVPWSMVGSIYGCSKAEIRFREKAVRQAFKGLGELEFFHDKKAAGIARFVKKYRATTPGSVRRRLMAAVKSVLTNKPIEVMALLPEMFNVVQGAPTKEIIKSAYFKNQSAGPTSWADPARDRCGVAWLAPVFPTRGEHLQALLALIKPQYKAYGFNFSGCITRLNDRSTMLLTGIFFDKQDPEESARAAQLHQHLVNIIYEHGYPPYRSGLMSWEENTEDGYRQFLQQLKRAIDPNGVYAPMRYGIAPTTATSQHHG